MHPQMINELLKNLSENESIIAIGCNALVSNHNKWRKAKFGNFKKDIIIKITIFLFNNINKKGKKK